MPGRLGILVVEGGRGRRGMRGLLFLRWVIGSVILVVVGRERGKKGTIALAKIDLCDRLNRLRRVFVTLTLPN